MISEIVKLVSITVAGTVLMLGSIVVSSYDFTTVNDLITENGLLDAQQTYDYTLECDVLMDKWKGPYTLCK